MAPGDGRAFPTVPVLGVPVAVTTVSRVAAFVRQAAEAAGTAARYVCATSVHGMIVATEDSEFHSILSRAAVVAPDGMPLVWVAHLRGVPEATRVYGPDLMLAVCRETAGLPIGHFFYGGRPGVADELAERLVRRFPGLRVAGTYSPPFGPLSDAERTQVARRINESGARVVWVGLSTPKQERWIAAMQPRLRGTVMLSVGAAFDFHTGRVRQAPAWMQQNGLEWAYRVSQEPRRLWRRYAHNNPRFILLAAADLLGWKRFGVGERAPVE